MEEKSFVEDNNNMTAVISEKEKELTFHLLDSVLAYILLALGFCFIHFVVWNVTGIFTTLFFISTTIICLIYLKMNDYRLNKSNIIWFALTLVFSLVFSITANNFIKFLDTVFVLLLGICWVYMVCKDNGRIDRFFFFDMLKAIFIMPFSGFSKAPKAIAYSASRSRHSNNIKLAVIGLVITIPLTALVATLLTSADSGIERMMNFIFGSIHENVISSVMKFFMGIPVAFYIFGMLYSNVRKEKAEVFSEVECKEKIKKIRLTPNVVMYSAVTPICILYIMFFISQLQYFFSAFMGQLPDAYSFAEYARKGFFELCAIAVINLMVLSVINLFSKNTGENKPVMLKIYSIMLSIFTVLIITTALSKMIMYIGEYGLTQLRVYTSWFMILLALTFILILIKQFKYHFNFAKYFVISFVFMFSILCFSNVDGIISKYNIDMYNAGQLKELDVEALCNLSNDGLIYVIEQGIDLDEYGYNHLEVYAYKPYETLNLSSFRVKRLLEKRSKVQ